MQKRWMRSERTNGRSVKELVIGEERTKKRLESHRTEQRAGLYISPMSQRLRAGEREATASIEFSLTHRDSTSFACRME